ncbi:MAG TPA: hypothetical protein VE646_12390 [Actinomycetota bacterium]|jgi:hypothetical protein|nr:hypothetical protein [Actinomycetota bacterium]
MTRRLLAITTLLVLAACTGRVPHGPSRSSPATSPAVSSTDATDEPLSPRRWTGTIVTRSWHDLYVGGRCSSDWRTAISVRERDGALTGSGTAVRTSTGPPCPFPVAQLQIHRFLLRVEGTVSGRQLTLRLHERSTVPSVGADDLGGFRTTTLGTVLHLQVRGGRVVQHLRLEAPDQDRGTFGSSNAVRLRCTGC